MNTKDKFCILFNLDENTQKVLREIHRQMHWHYDQTVSGLPKAGDLPYHMTIIGDITLDTNISTALINRTVEDILPFTDPTKIPAPKRLESCELNGNVLGIRLVFAEGTYIITGDPYKNRDICSLLGATNFKFDATRHVSVCKVSGDFRSLDKVSSRFIETLLWYKPDLMKMKLTPEVWKKNATGWEKFELKL